MEKPAQKLRKVQQRIELYMTSAIESRCISAVPWQGLGLKIPAAPNVSDNSGSARICRNQSIFQ
jgi:hypothetical protein